MTTENVLFKANDHRVSRDSRQWIVRHPYTCANARRGAKGSYAYAKKTYFTQEYNLRNELVACHVVFPAAQPSQSPRLDNGQTLEKRVGIREGCENALQGLKTGGQ